MYEVMVYWETADTLADQSPSPEREFAEIWKAADKIVYSKTLEQAASAQDADRAGVRPEAVRRLKGSAERDLSVGGPDLAAQAIKAGLVDELHLFVAPIIVGGGTPWLPGGVRLKLELLDERRFGSGVVLSPVPHQHLGEINVWAVAVPTLTAVVAQPSQLSVALRPRRVRERFWA
jgi:riboflavin biosynthesis pyrimidine reductase